jgi:hypothetical protein
MRMAMIRDKTVNIKSKRAIIAAARRIVFAGIILLAVRLILLILKERFPLARLDSLILLIWMMTGDALLERHGLRSKMVWSKTME